jgi:hypothetical protein
LTAVEQMRLDQLARQLREDDPELADALSSPDARPRNLASAPHWALLVGILTAAAVLVLLAGVVGGVGGALAVVVTLLCAFAGWRVLQQRRGLRH